MKNALIHIISILLFGYLLPPASAQTKSAETVRKIVKDILTEKDMKNAILGVCAIYRQNSEVIALNDENISLATASTLKVITSIGALMILGKDFQYETELLYDGKIDAEGVLNGNIYIKGSGDPTLGIKLNETLNEWVTKIQEKGIKKITGAIVADERIFDYHVLPSTWIWEDIGNYYGAPVSGLNFHENLYKLHLKPGGLTGEKVKIMYTEPEVAGITFFNEMRTGAPNSGDNGYIFGAPFSPDRYLRGTIPAGTPSFTIKGAVPDPSLFAAQLLENALKKKSISVGKHATNYRLAHLNGVHLPESKAKNLIFKHNSEKLETIIETLNQKSINLYAEALIKTIGVKQKGKGTTEDGINALMEFFKAKNIPTEGLIMEDGSGLSRFNLVTPKTLCLILQYAGTQPDIYKPFFKSLPIAGHTGTLKNFGKGMSMEGKVIAKSGYMKRVRSYAGYAKTNSGKEVTFVIIANNFQGDIGAMDKRCERILNAIVEL